jgi:hypothetical protein
MGLFRDGSIDDAASEDQPPSGPTLLQSLHAVWLTMRVIYPFQAAAFIPPLVTAAILPMVFGMDFSQVRWPLAGY